MSKILVDIQETKGIHELLQMLKSNNTFVRINVINALGKFKAVEIIPKLLEMISDENTNIREYGVAAIAGLKTTEAIPYLIKI